MKKNIETLAAPLKGPSPLFVSHRRRKHLNIKIPVVREGPDPKELELKRIQEKFEGTTPQEREIIRKIAFRIEQALTGALQAKAQKQSRPAQPEPSPPLVAASTKPVSEMSQVNFPAPALLETKTLAPVARPEAESIPQPTIKPLAGGQVSHPTEGTVPAQS